MTKLQQRNIPKYQLGNKSPYTPYDFTNLPFLPKQEENENIVPYAPFDDEEEELEIEPWMKDTGFWNKTTDKTAEDKYKDLLTRKFDVVGDKSGAALGAITGAIKPAMALGSAYMNWQQLKKTRDAAKNIKSPRVDAATMPNRPIQGISPDIINLYLKQIGGIKTKKTSDATANIIGEQMSNINKMGAMDKLATKQVENLQKERQRSDKIKAINAQESVKAMNEQSKHDVDIYNKKSAIDAAYEGKKQDFINRWVEEALVKPMEKRVAYNLGKEAIEKSDAQNNLQTQIVNAQNRLKLEPTNVKYKKALDDLLTEQSTMLTRSMPSYGRSMSYLFKNK